MTIQERQYTAVDFWEIAAQRNSDILIELINGEIVEVNPPRRINSILAFHLGKLIGNHADAHDLGTVLGADGGFIFNAANVRVPDISFVVKDRVAEMHIAEENDSIFAPDLAVEVISPSESARAISEKTTLYLSSGVKIVWNIYPDDEKVEVWTTTAANQYAVTVLSNNGTLTGGNVLPGFELKLADLFAPLN